MNTRSCKEGRQLQGTDEAVYYSITTTPWGTAPSNVVVVVKDAQSMFGDVTSTVTSGSAVVNGDVITLPKLQNLTEGHTYRVEVRFDTGGNTFECYFYVQCEM